jgi:superfamily II DNA or RNA helicase
VQGAEFSQAYRKGRWDGRKHLFSRTGAFPTGLLASVRAVLEKDGVEVQVDDWRIEPTPSERGFDLIGITFDPPYDYQLDACRKMVQAKQGIIKMGTGAGKTEVACAVTQYLGLNTLFIVPTRELMYQSQKRFIKRLGLSEREVGLIGDNNWCPGSLVTVATAATLESRLETQQCQDLLKSIDVLFLDECVEERAVISTEGGYRLAKDIQLGDKVLTHKGYRPVIRSSSHTKSGVKIYTEYGGCLTCSEEHPVAVWKDWRIQYIQAKDLSKDDLLLEVYKKGNIGVVPEFNVKRYVQGVFAGDGHWHTPNKVRWAYRKDKQWWETVFVKAILEAYPTAVITTSKNNRGDYNLIVEDPHFLSDLLELGFTCRQHKSKNLAVPTDFLNSYIGGIFDAEGYKTSDGAIAFQTTCETSQRIFLRYLRDWGLDARFCVCKKKNDKHNTGYRIYLANEYVDKFFYITNPLMTRKRPSPRRKNTLYSKGEDIVARRVLKELSSCGLSKVVLEKLSGTNLFRKKIPFSELRVLCNSILANPVLYAECIKKHSAAPILGVNVHTIYNKNQALDKERVNKLVAHLLSLVYFIYQFDAPEVCIRPRTIKFIEKEESIKTVEFEVQEDHTFVADGMLTHNCHRTGSDTYFTVATLCPAYYRFGLSGTPLYRSDGANLMLIAATGEMIADVGLKYLIEKGICAKANIIFDKITEPVLKKKTAYATAYKQGVSENPQLLKKVIEWTEICVDQGLGVLILCEEIQHGKLIDDALWTETSKLIPHQFIHGTEDTSVRRAAIESFDKRNLPVLIASTILDEGVDTKAIDVIILAGSRKSKIKTLQRIGRGLRGEKLIVIEFSNWAHKYLLEHSYQRLQDYKEEGCFPIHYSGPDASLVKKLWSES